MSKLDELVGSLSHGEHRQVALAMALAASRSCSCSTNPRPGLSRGERQLLTDLLLALDPEITLISDRARHGHRVCGSPSASR